MNDEVSSGWSEETWRDGILRRQVRLRCHVIRNLARNLKQGGDFPTPTPEKLCDLIRHTVDVLEAHLTKTPPDQLANVNLFLCSTAEHLRYVERSRIAHTPWSMIQATEHFLKQQVEKDSHFIIRPQWSYNYSLLGEFVEYHRTSIQSMGWISPGSWEEGLAAIKLASKKIYCIAFPRIERLNVLLHANWGHELGHIIAAAWVHSRFSQLWNTQEQEIRTRIQKAIEPWLAQQAEQPLFKQVIIDQYVSDQANTAMLVAQQGLTELICDAVGIQLLGPSALAASLEFCAGMALDESPLRCGKYPPWRYRLRLMLEACDEDLREQKMNVNGKDLIYPGDTVRPLYEWLSEAKRLVAETGDQMVLKQDVAVREAYNLIEEKWKGIRSEALAILPTRSQESYRLSRRLEIVEDLVQKLDNGLPPNEVGLWPDTDPARFEDIISAAWVLKAKKQSHDSEWRDPEDFERLYRLVLKGIEASYVHSAYGNRLREVYAK